MKICGITSEEDLSGAVKAGADAVGFVMGFESSRRNIPFRRASRLVSLVPPFVQSVLVTNRTTLFERRKEVDAIDADAVQLYGREIFAADLEPIRATLIRPYFVGSATDPRKEVEGFDALLTTGHDVGEPGGRGSAPDLRLCAAVRRKISPIPLILSGGLEPETVRDAILAVRPYAVDVSSGVEASPGTKDMTKMTEFVRNAKEAERPA